MRKSLKNFIIINSKLKNFMKLFSLFIFILIFFNDFIEKVYKLFNKKTHYIHIAMSLNNNYTYPIMVSITSILLNSEKTTFITFHLLIGYDVEIENIKKISTLKKLNNNSNFIFHKIKNNFQGWKSSRKDLTVATFYRVILPEIIRDVDKIIYLDGDTLTYGDLTEMYNLDMTSFCFKGFREFVSKKIRYSNINRYICAGVMLMNLRLLRKYKSFQKIKKYYYFLTTKGLYYHDQHLINAIFADKIGFLPPKYGIFHINHKYIEACRKKRPLIYNKLQLINANKKPVIRHIFGKIPSKPWLTKGNYQIKNEWNYYANKTGYYSLICKFFKNACVNVKFN